MNIDRRDENASPTAIGQKRTHSPRRPWITGWFPRLHGNARLLLMVLWQPLLRRPSGPSVALADDPVRARRTWTRGVSGARYWSCVKRAQSASHPVVGSVWLSGSLCDMSGLWIHPRTPCPWLHH